jgi:hypothetical protein
MGVGPLFKLDLRMETIVLATKKKKKVTAWGWFLESFID